MDTERGWRGGERQVLWLARNLAAMGHRSLIAARPDEPLADRAREAGLAVVPLAPWSEIDPLAAMRLRALVRRERVDVVHAHTGHAVAPAALATLGTPVPMVLTRRVDFPLKQNPGTRWKYARAAAVIAVSGAVAESLVASGVARERITVVPSGIDLSRTFIPASRDTLAAFGVPPGARIVVQVGQLVSQKDPLTLIRAWTVAAARAADAHLLVVGDGPLRSEVEAAIETLGPDARVHLAGYRTDADAFIAAADVVALSSVGEGIPGVVMDAMSQGKPVAATAAGGTGELIEHGVSGLVVPTRDPAALGDAIASLLTDGALARRLGEAARVRVRLFSAEHTARRTAEVYARVVTP
ncbi:MAG TPA: glycosyltransferase family 4 protein [Gemmatimonadaceae bacterium]|nr:glycosyltransferase family 4 protein [Gemmatimonadaceae bacterium]